MIYDDVDKGVLFKNHRKAKDTDPDYTGNLNANGIQYWLSGWLRESRNGVEYLSLSVKKKTATAGKTDGALNANNSKSKVKVTADQAPTLDLPPPASTAVPLNDFDDEVPF
jgi:hypothetical protein